MSDVRPEFPYDRFATEDPQHREALDAFRTEYASDVPDASRLDEHAERVRTVPALVADFERWWLSPRVQAFISEINGTGL